MHLEVIGKSNERLQLVATVLHILCEESKALNIFSMTGQHTVDGLCSIQ